MSKKRGMWQKLAYLEINNDSWEIDSNFSGIHPKKRAILKRLLGTWQKFGQEIVKKTVKVNRNLDPKLSEISRKIVKIWTWNRQKAIMYSNAFSFVYNIISKVRFKANLWQLIGFKRTKKYQNTNKRFF